MGQMSYSRGILQNAECRMQNAKINAGCKENHFYSLPFVQAEASIY